MKVKLLKFKLIIWFDKKKYRFQKMYKLSVGSGYSQN